MLLNVFYFLVKALAKFGLCPLVDDPWRLFHLPHKIGKKKRKRKRKLWNFQWVFIKIYLIYIF